MRPGNILGRARLAARQAWLRLTRKRRLRAGTEELRRELRLARLESDIPTLMPKTFGPNKKAFRRREARLREALKGKEKEMRRIEKKGMAGAGKRR